MAVIMRGNGVFMTISAVQTREGQMRRLFTLEEAMAGGLTRSALRWGERCRRWRRIDYAVFADGPDDPNAFDAAHARVLAARGVASGPLAAMLHGLDGVVSPDDRPLPERLLPPERVVVVAGLRCTDGLQTLVDLAADLDDDTWEQVLESALRKGLRSVAELEHALPELGQARTRGVRRMRRVLALRPDGTRPTESLLETLMVQLIRMVDGDAAPVRQHRIVDEHGAFVGRVDLAWPELGLFVELDGQQHAGQPVYDARGETAVVAATGWLPGRFTWHEVVRVPRSTSRRLAALARRARQRASGSGSSTG
jgi:very-short-patch-repair endonuclease